MVHAVYLHACIGFFFLPEVTRLSREYAEYTISGAFEIMASHGTKHVLSLKTTKLEFHRTHIPCAR